MGPRHYFVIKTTTLLVIILCFLALHNVPVVNCAPRPDDRDADTRQRQAPRDPDYFDVTARKGQSQYTARDNDAFLERVRKIGYASVLG